MEPDGSFNIGGTSYIFDLSEEPGNSSANIKTEKNVMPKSESVKLECPIYPENIKDHKTVQENPIKVIKKPIHPIRYTDSIAAKMELEKHRYNIRTILQFSNATPIRTHNLGSGYVCSFCKASFIKAADLKNHTINHDVRMKRAFKPLGGLTSFLVKLDITSLCCNICNFAPDTLDQLMNHLTSVHAIKLHTDIKNHIVSFKLDDEAFKCHICSTDFNSFRCLKSHMNKYFPNFICDVCGATFVNRIQLYVHTDAHKNGTFKCRFCEKIFLSAIRRKTHETRTHIAVGTTYRCFHCGDKFKNRTDKQKHMVKVHGAKYADLKCNACDKTFKNSANLQKHKVKDHLMRRWFCKLCDKVFYRADRLKKHELIHTGIRNFSCDVCSKAFLYKYSLTEHMRTHSKKQ